MWRLGGKRYAVHWILIIGLDEDRGGLVLVGLLPFFCFLSSQLILFLRDVTGGQQDSTELGLYYGQGGLYKTGIVYITSAVIVRFCILVWCCAFLLLEGSRYLLTMLA